MKTSSTLIKGNILSTLLRFAIPILCALFLQSLYGGIDLLIVGQFSDTANLSGVSTGSMFMQTVTMIITGLSMGITILVAQRIGEENYAAVGKVIGNGITLFFFIAVFTTIFLVIFSNSLTALLHAPKEAFEETSSYIIICGLGLIFIVSYNILGAIFRGLGDSTTPLITVFISCIINIIGDYIFVAILHFGSSGAAIATVLSQGISVFISLLFIKNKQLPFSITKESLYPKKQIILTELKIGFPLALQEFLVGSSFLIIQTIVNTIGLTASAGVGVAEKVCGFIMLVPSAYMQAMAAFVAQNLGAGLPKRCSRALVYGISSSLFISLIISWYTFFHGDQLAHIFSTEPAVIQAAHSYLKAYAIDTLLTSVLFCMMGYFNGHEKTFFVMIQALIGALFIRVPASFFFCNYYHGSLFHIGLATPCASAIQIFLCICMLFRFKSKKIL